MPDSPSAADYVFVHRVPTPDEHRALARSVDWDDHFDWGSIPASLAASVFGVVALWSETAVGMGRVVGDGVHYFYIQDVIVHPDHTEAGVGSEIVSHLLAQVAETAPAQAFVGLFASDVAVGLYESADFSIGPDMTGMHRFIDPAS